MRAVTRLWLIVALVLMSLRLASPAAAVAPETAWPTNRELLFGVAGHGWWLEQHLDTFVAAQRDLGMTSVRLSIDWKYIEPEPGVYRWDRYDYVLDRLLAEGFTIVGVFVTVPAWVASDPAACAVEQNEPKGCDIPASRMGSFDAVTRAVLERYPFIRYWEFWNEPELWTHIGRDVGAYVPWLARFYAIAKDVDPEVMVAASTLAGWDYLGWLYDVSEAMLGAGRRPWDAVAFHPYNTNRARDASGAILPLRFDDIERIRAEMVARGDAHKPIWITEYGWDEDPETQAARFRWAMEWMLAQSYITMAHVHMLHDWEKETHGLMRTIPDVVGRGPITAETTFVPKEPYYSAYRDFPRPLLPLGANHPGVFPTGQVIAPEFRTAWEEGGVERYGYPLGRPTWERRAQGDYVLTQYFERARFEWQRSTGVRRGLLGDETLQRRGWLDARGAPLVAATEPVTPPAGGDALFFPETGQALAGDFRAVWEANGGLVSLGYPRTRPLSEALPDGSTRLVQHTQRARLEQIITADGAGPVTLGRLGAEALQARGWLDGAGQPVPGYLNPARRAYR